MLTNFQSSFTARLSSKFIIRLLLQIHHTLNMLLHYLVKYTASFWLRVTGGFYVPPYRLLTDESCAAQQSYPAARRFDSEQSGCCECIRCLVHVRQSHNHRGRTERQTNPAESASRKNMEAYVDTNRQTDMIWYNIFTCAQKLTASQLNQPHGTENKK